MENVIETLTFPTAPPWIVETPVFLETFRLGRRRAGGLGNVQAHNATMLLKNIARWAARECFRGLFGDERKIRRVRQSYDQWRDIVGDAEWISDDPNWVLEGHGRTIPIEEHLAQQRQFIDPIVIAETEKQRQRLFYLGDRFLLRFAEESVPLALQRFNPKHHTTGQSAYDLLMECLGEVLRLALFPPLRRPGTKLLDVEQRASWARCGILALKSLSPLDRQIWLDRELGKASFQRIANNLTSLGCRMSPGAARVRFHRTQKKLEAKSKQLLREAYEADE